MIIFKAQIRSKRASTPNSQMVPRSLKQKPTSFNSLVKSDRPLICRPSASSSSSAHPLRVTVIPLLSCYTQSAAQLGDLCTGVSSSQSMLLPDHIAQSVFFPRCLCKGHPHNEDLFIVSAPSPHLTPSPFPASLVPLHSDLFHI